MKKPLYLLLLAGLAAGPARAQHYEFSARLSGSAFNFRGAGAPSDA